MEAQFRAGVGQVRWQVIWFMDRRIGRGRVSRATLFVSELLVYLSSNRDMR